MKNAELFSKSETKYLTMNAVGYNKFTQLIHVTVMLMGSYVKRLLKYILDFLRAAFTALQVPI